MGQTRLSPDELATITADWQELNYALAAKFEEVNGEDFYREIFPSNEVSGEQYTDFSHPNAIYLYQVERTEDDKLHQPDGGAYKQARRIMLNDTWTDDYREYVECNELALCTGFTYRGKKNQDKYAQAMNALIFDLDEVTLEEWNIFWARVEVENIKQIPQPTYVASSGTGLHIYYLLDEPIVATSYMLSQLKVLKNALFYRMADPTQTTRAEKIQYLRPTQSFRMVGSVNGKYGLPIIAYRTGEPVSIDYLNGFVPEKARLNKEQWFKPSKIKLDEAKEKYPEWYQRRIVEGKSALKWDIGAKVHGDDPYALYHWWMRQVDHIIGGHRYFFMLCMVWYASKNNVPYKTLKRDLEETIYPRLCLIPHKKGELTPKDISSALKTYKKDMYNVKIDDIEKLAGITILRNKRNGRKQSDHIKLMNFIRDEINQNSTWNKIGNGRPKKHEIVRQWRVQHPDGKKAECIRDTGLSKPTVYKWWSYTGEVEENIDISQYFTVMNMEEFNRYIYRECNDTEGMTDEEIDKEIEKEVNAALQYNQGAKSLVNQGFVDE